jgi:hypothetical protein
MSSAGHRSLACCVSVWMPIALLAAGSVEAGTIDVPGDYTTIQAAIDAPTTAGGDEVVVAADVYHERIDFRGKAITVRSTNPDDPGVVAATIVDGDAGGSVVTFSSGEGNGSVLAGFTIRNGNATRGGGIYCGGTSPVIRSNVIVGNTAVEDGGGIYCNASSPAIVDNRIEGNSAMWGGGISCYTRSSPAIQRNTIIGNSCVKYAGGIYCMGSGSAAIVGNRIVHNTGGWGAGIACVDGSSPSIRRNVIRSNEANGAGGGIYCGRSSPTIVDNIIGHNTTGEGPGTVRMGGGICCQDENSATIRRNTINRNWAAQAGGGIYCAAGRMRISHNTIARNSAADGGGIGCMGATAAAIRHNVMALNAARATGGGIGCYGGSTPMVEGNTISGNRAGGGGGIYCASSSSLTVINSIVAFSARGRGVQSNGALSMRFSNVYGNAGGNYAGMADPTGTDGNISEDPLFADAPGGDFHLRSRGGRWDPGASGWVIDVDHSPCIDVGDPASPWQDEPAPNFGRVNMGAYGNTAEASKWANRPPTLAWVGQGALANGGVDPAIGEPESTQFDFRMKITDLDGTPPRRMYVRIRRMEDRRRWQTLATLPLAAVGGTWADGMVCGATTTLPNGSYVYRFYATDNEGMVATGEPVRWHPGPEIVAPPQLWCTGLAGRTYDYLEPGVGVADHTRFSFAVQYTDGEGTLPLVHQLELQKKVADGTWHHFKTIPMKAWAGGPADGKLYVWQTKLPAGEYRHRFVFEDEDGPATGADSAGPDATQWVSGPNVREAGPDAVAGGRATTVSVAAVPSGGGAEIVLSLSAPMAVDARVLNVAGRPVRTLCRAQECSAGTSTLLWNAQSDRGLAVPNGTYVIEVMAKAADGGQARSLTQVGIDR